MRSQRIARQLLALLGLCLSVNALAAPKSDLWGFWNNSDPQGLEQVDHSTWQTLLTKTIVTAADGSTAVRYDAFDDATRQQLDGYINQLSALDPRTLNRNEQMAYWINLYNALTIQVVLNNPGKNSILRMGGGWLPTGPWDDEVATIVEQTLTLNDIEHRILRPIWQDHRVHFAVNCASIGCPDLSATAYTADNLEQMLDGAERAYLSHERGLRFKGKRLVLSSIFDWYMDDFASDRQGMLDYLASVRTDIAPALRSYERGMKYQYDWGLNRAR